MSKGADKVSVLGQTMPFLFLKRDRLEAVAAKAETRGFAAGEPIALLGETDGKVFVLVSGAVARKAPGRPSTAVVPLQCFGERAVLFAQPREAAFVATTPSDVLILPQDAFLELLELPVFANAYSRLLRSKYGIFSRYLHLKSRLFNLLSRRSFLLADVVEAYAALKPALHAGLGSSEIDTAALSYAVDRLPSDVTRTCFYYLCTTLPAIYDDPSAKFTPVATRARRRPVWQLLPGKNIVLLRDRVTDVMDFVTCLCLFAIEAKKIRRRIRSSANLRELRSLADSPDAEAQATLWFERLDLSEQERAGLKATWPENTWKYLRDIVLLHEDIGLECDLAAIDHRSSASEAWVNQLKKSASELVDLDDPELEVHIISSNTHSVANCLSTYWAEHGDEVLLWGRDNCPELCGEPTVERPWGGLWHCREDLLYALAREYFAQVPAARKIWTQHEKKAGHVRLMNTALTGIAVDLFDARNIESERTDPGAGAVTPGCPCLIVNVDYAFGQQAGGILANLLYLFGRSVASVNIIGKAGGLLGDRGDILVADATILQGKDELYAVRGEGERDAESLANLLQTLLPQRDVHVGPVLTVAGTLLQDRTLIQFYRRVHRCVGLEMEGSYFLRQLESAIAHGIVKDNVQTRLAYYTSDLPLATEHNLSGRMPPHEGVPPLYAITRGILRRVFEGCR